MSYVIYIEGRYLFSLVKALTTNYAKKFVLKIDHAWVTCTGRWPRLLNALDWFTSSLLIQVGDMYQAARCLSIFEAVEGVINSSHAVKLIKVETLVRDFSELTAFLGEDCRIVKERIVVRSGLSARIFLLFDPSEDQRKVQLRGSSLHPAHSDVVEELIQRL